MSCSDDCSVKLWSLSEGCLKSIESHQGPVNSVCLMSNGKTLLSGGSDCVLMVYEISENGDMSLKDQMCEVKPINLVSSFYNNSSFALVATVDGIIKIWNIHERKCLHAINGHTNLICGVITMTC